MSPQQFKLIKNVVKIGVGFGFTFLLGKIYEVGKQSEDKIDTWFDEKYPQTDTKNI